MWNKTLAVAGVLLLASAVLGCTTEADFDETCHGPRGFWLPFEPGVAPRASRTWRATSPAQGIGQHSGNSQFSYDWAMPTGTQVVASKAGTVVIAGFSSTAGNWVVLQHGEQLFSTYMHLSRIQVQRGNVLSAGDKVGLVGNTGRSGGPHLHTGLRTTAGGGSAIPFFYEEHIRAETMGNGEFFWPPKYNSDFETVPSLNEPQPAEACTGAARNAVRNAACCPELPTIEGTISYCYDTSNNPGLCVPEGSCPDSVNVQTVDQTVGPQAAEDYVNGSISTADVVVGDAGGARYVTKGTCGGPANEGYVCCFATAKCCASDLFEGVVGEGAFCETEGKLGKCLNTDEDTCANAAGVAGEFVPRTGYCRGGNEIQCCIPPQDQCVASNLALVAGIGGALLVGGAGTGAAVYRSRTGQRRRRRSKKSKADADADAEQDQELAKRESASSSVDLLKGGPTAAGSALGGASAGRPKSRGSRASKGSKARRRSSGGVSRKSKKSAKSGGSKNSKGGRRGSGASKGSKTSKGSRGRRSMGSRGSTGSSGNQLEVPSLG